MVFSREFQRVGAHTRKARELKTIFVRRTVRRLAEVERRSLDGAYGIRGSDKYDGVARRQNLVCKCGQFVSYAPLMPRY